MSDSDLQITIAADASGVGQGAGQAKAAIASLTSALSGAQSTFAGFGSTVTKAFAAPNVSGLTGAIGQVRSGCADMAGALGGVVQGAGQARSSLDGVHSSIAGFGDAFQVVSSKITSGFGGVGTALKGLQTAGAAGAEGLAGVTQVAGGATAAIAAVVGVAISAAAAIASWAERTRDSSAASAAARQNATALTGALAGAGAAFGQVGDTLASGFAPALTILVAGLASMANAFEASYKSGGAARTQIDLAAAGVNALTAAVTEIIALWKTEIDLVTDFGRAGSDALRLLATLVQDLKNALTTALSPAFKLVRDDAGAAWGAVQSSFAALLKALTVGYDGWKALNGPLVGAIGGIGSAFTAVEAAAQSVFQNILAWIVKVSNGLVAFLEKLPGVGAGFQQLQADLAKSANDANANIGTIVAIVQPAQPRPAPPASPATPSPPSGAAAQDQVLATTNATNAQISASNQGVTTKFVAGVTQQVAAARSADSALAQSSAETARQIAANQKKAFNEFKSALDQTVAVFTKGLLEMGEGAKSFSQVMRSIGQQILNDMLKVVDGMIDKWAMGVAENVLASTQGQALLNALGMKDLAQYIAIQTRKVAASSAGNAAIAASSNASAAAGSASTLAITLATLRQDAAKVFGGIFAALSQNPATLPAAAPAAAAGAAMVMSYAAGGWGEVPADDMPTLLHRQEMVLPARLANPMRDMLSSYGSAGGLPAGGHSFSFGDTHIHGAPNMSPSDFKQALLEHRSNVAEAVAGALRGGWRPSYKQPVGAL
jgi:hypothetical protein